jgi:hypothetical protein
MDEIDPYGYVRHELQVLLMAGLRENPFYFPDLTPAMGAAQIVALYGGGISSLFPISLEVH